MQVFLVENGALIFIGVKNPNTKTYFTQCGRLCSGSNKNALGQDRPRGFLSPASGSVVGKSSRAKDFLF